MSGTDEGNAIGDDGSAIDEGRLRRARYAVAAVFCVHGAVAGSFATRMPWIQDHAGVSAGQLGLALAFPAIGASMAMPLAGRVTHRFGARTALRGMLAQWTMALVLPSLAPGLPTLCLALFVFGATAGMSDVAMNALGVDDAFGSPGQGAARQTPWPPPSMRPLPIQRREARKRGPGWQQRTRRRWLAFPRMPA